MPFQLSCPPSWSPGFPPLPFPFCQRVCQHFFWSRNQLCFCPTLTSLYLKSSFFAVIPTGALAVEEPWLIAHHSTLSLPFSPVVSDEDSQILLIVLKSRMRAFLSGCFWDTLALVFSNLIKVWAWISLNLSCLRFAELLEWVYSFY